MQGFAFHPSICCNIRPDVTSIHGSSTKKPTGCNYGACHAEYAGARTYDVLAPTRGCRGFLVGSTTSKTAILVILGELPDLERGETTERTKEICMTEPIPMHWKRLFLAKVPFGSQGYRIIPIKAFN